MFYDNSALVYAANKTLQRVAIVPFPYFNTSSCRCFWNANPRLLSPGSEISPQPDMSSFWIFYCDGDIERHCITSLCPMFVCLSQPSFVVLKAHCESEDGKSSFKDETEPDRLNLVSLWPNVEAVWVWGHLFDGFPAGVVLVFDGGMSQRRRRSRGFEGSSFDLCLAFLEEMTSGMREQKANGNRGVTLDMFSNVNSQSRSVGSC